MFAKADGRGDKFCGRSENAIYLYGYIVFGYIGKILQIKLKPFLYIALREYDMLFAAGRGGGRGRGMTQNLMTMLQIFAAMNDHHHNSYIAQ